jgi:hypothetical protein
MSSNPSIEGKWSFSYLGHRCQAIELQIDTFENSWWAHMSYYVIGEIPSLRLGQSPQPIAYDYHNLTFTIVTGGEPSYTFTFTGAFTDENTIKGEWSGHYTGATTMTRA